MRLARRRGRPGLLVAVAVALVALVAGACLPASLGAGGPRRLLPRGPAGPWRLTFDEEFTGASLDTARWATCYDWACTNAGNNELEWYEARNVTVGGGAAHLTARARPSHHKPYTSGLIQSNHHYVFRYGYAAINARLPRGRGLWSAFWLAPANDAWPPEIDVVENRGTPVPEVHVHWGRADHVVGGPVPGVRLGPGYHTFGVDWEPHTLTWYIDGVARFRTHVTITTPMYLLANLAIDGATPPDRSTHFPAVLDIDWIRVWQRPGAGG